ncbi:MAG: nitrite reductase (NAD(P)H), partial [Gammaproteobacteria bacterium]|nr:nitrite reductase (NAD(P)H) [Gammaproteobacteria bacterium]
VGVIATEKGWNLFVAGNGGMRPRHAELFATDLDDETLVKYIDRILMFYVRTADRLQRTSVWLEKLEGGIDYLKSVVIEDRLHLAQELEEQMEMLVDSYACEWKTTIEDPAKLKRFRHFVNSDEKDNTIQFVRERGQKRPAIVEA